MTGVVVDLFHGGVEVCSEERGEREGAGPRGGRVI